MSSETLSRMLDGVITTSYRLARSVLGSINQYIVALDVFGITNRSPEAWNRSFLKWLPPVDRGKLVTEPVLKRMLDVYATPGVMTRWVCAIQKQDLCPMNRRKTAIEYDGDGSICTPWRNGRTI